MQTAFDTAGTDTGTQPFGRHLPVEVRRGVGPNDAAGFGTEEIAVVAIRRGPR